MNGETISIGDYCWKESEFIGELFKITDIVIANADTLNKDDDTQTIIVCRSITIVRDNTGTRQSRWNDRKIFPILLEDFETSYVHQKRAPKRFSKTVATTEK